jgi:Bacteriocin-protection, YdeI or OmpD-Associated
VRAVRGFRAKRVRPAPRRRDARWPAKAGARGRHRAKSFPETVKRACARLTYHGPVSGQRVPGGVVHKLPADLRKALIANATALDAWKNITPLARNEFICWVEDAKQETTRERRIRRAQEELEEGQRRPCCWPGCKHRERTGK